VIPSIAGSAELGQPRDLRGRVDGLGGAAGVSPTGGNLNTDDGQDTPAEDAVGGAGGAEWE
jgi:hypothetical protein